MQLESCHRVPAAITANQEMNHAEVAMKTRKPSRTWSFRLDEVFQSRILGFNSLIHFNTVKLGERSPQDLITKLQGGYLKSPCNVVKHL